MNLLCLGHGRLRLAQTTPATSPLVQNPSDMLAAVSMQRNRIALARFFARLQLVAATATLASRAETGNTWFQS